MSENEIVAEEVRSRRWTLPMGVLVVALSYAPLVLLHFRQLWLVEHYRYFPLVLVAFGWLLWSRSRQASCAFVLSCPER